MPRKPRFYLPGVPAHIVQRGHSRLPVFFENDDYAAYLEWLGEASQRYGCSIHAYVLMTNHIHILATPDNMNSISQMMQYVGRHYMPYINYTYGTSGTIWEGRYKASLVHDEEYLLTCMRYIELNPVRADMVKSPGAYRWSSYRANALGKPNDLIQPHPLYLRLGRTVKQRQEAYRALFRAHIDEKALNDIRAAWQTGTPLGNDYFRQKIEAKLKCKVGHARRGRPSLPDDPAR
jgi:putative transposase